MTIPTGHQTITHDDNRRSRGQLFRAAREGDTYVDASGKHWECRGTFMRPIPQHTGSSAACIGGGSGGTQEAWGAGGGAGAPTAGTGSGPSRTWHGAGVQMQNLPRWGGTLRENIQQCANAQAQNLPKDWRQERGIPPSVEIKYETSYTKTVVDAMWAAKAIIPKCYVGAHTALISAADLLKDYHSSLSAPYAQRDKARQDLTAAERQLVAMRSKLIRLRRMCASILGR